MSELRSGQSLASKISPSELEVLDVLWQADRPLPLADIRGALSRSRGWDGSTVKTLLRRLCEKQAVEAEKRQVFYYRPLLTRQAFRDWSTGSFLARVFQGSARELVASLVERADLTPADLEELRAILYPGDRHE